MLGALVIFIFMSLFVLVLLSPRQDLQERGFIPCTKQLAASLLDCQENSKFGCFLGAITQNTFCDIGVVAKGFEEWAKGAQSTPWSNYIFVPELIDANDESEQDRLEYLRNNAGTLQEMLKLEKLNKELDHEIDVDENEKPK